MFYLTRLNPQYNDDSTNQPNNMTNIRKRYKQGSNNQQNPNKNICALRVAQALDVDDKVRYIHTITDLVRASRFRWQVRSRNSKLIKKGKTTVSQLKKKLLKHIDKEKNILALIVHVEGHVLLLDSDSTVLVDTAPRKRDVRKVFNVYAVTRKTF
tara:strand:- start:308 stop:772 length:465 start_codon:yes stop_codon:yes gene_type:complete